MELSSVYTQIKRYSPTDLKHKAIPICLEEHPIVFNRVHSGVCYDCIRPLQVLFYELFWPSSRNQWFAHLTMRTITKLFVVLHFGLLMVKSSMPGFYT